MSPSPGSPLSINQKQDADAIATSQGQHRMQSTSSQAAVVHAAAQAGISVDKELPKLVSQLIPITKKSSLDDREYASFVLPNGLQVVLVSDPKTTESAAAMCVNIGYFQDQQYGIAGLAHFLEHMLFLGTEKYPDEKEYKQFLSQHGGHSNASTAAEETNYHFSVNSAFLADALDRFSAFFTCPLFTPSSTTREMQAVDAEFRRNLQDDGRRILQVLKHTANQTNPFSGFSTGNNDTLGSKSIEEIRSILMELHRKYYRAENMKLCVLGRESLAELRDLVTERFGSVPGNLTGLLPPFSMRKTGVDMPTYEPLYQEQHLRKLHKIVPVEDFRSLSIYWELPPQFANYRKKPLSYINHLIEQQSEGSLYQYLKNELKYINSISAGVYSTTTALTLYKITVSLTELGQENTDQIVKHIFEVLEWVKVSLESEKGREMYQEQAQVCDISFRFLEKGGPYGYTKNLVKRLWDYPTEELLYAPFGLVDFDPATIRGLLDRMSPQNMRMYMVSPDFAKNENLLTEPIYGTKYAEEYISAALIRDLGSVSANPIFGLPPKNEFVAESFDVRPSREDAPYHPQVLLYSEDPYHLVWYNEKTKFNVPYADIISTISLHADRVAHVRGSLLFQLYVNHVHNSLSEISYQASVADADFEVSYAAMEGLVVSFSGFSDKLVRMADLVYQHIMDPKKIDQACFDRIKKNMIRFFENQDLMGASSQAYYAKRMLTQYPFHHHSRYLKLLPEITLEELRSFISTVHKEARIETFVNGNLSRDQVKDLVQVVHKRMPYKTLPELETGGFVVALQLPRGDTEFVIESQNTNEDDVNSAVVVEYQLGQRNKKNKILVELLQKVMGTAFFDEMRTKQQLGYSVSSGSAIYEDIIAFDFCIQAPAHSADEVHRRINKFLYEKFPVVMRETVTEKAFEEYRQALLEAKQRPLKKLAEETERFYAEIAYRRFEWDRLQLEIDVLKSVSREQLFEFYDKYFLPSNGEGVRKVSSLVYSKDRPLSQSRYRQEWSSNEEMHVSPMHKLEFVENPVEFKTNLASWPYQRRPLSKEVNQLMAQDPIKAEDIIKM